MSTVATAEQPATIPVTQAPMTLREHIDAAEKGLTELPNPAALVVPVVEEPVDPELQAAVDAVEAPKAEETPQEKAARTKRNQGIADKAIKTRLAHARDREKERADRAERELTDLRQRQQAPPVALQGQPQPARAVQPSGHDGAHPDDPEPTLDAFGDTTDPYVEWTRARTDWAARREVRRAQVAARDASRAGQAEERRITALRAFDTHAAELRTTEPGFDAAIEHLDLSGPMQAVIFGSGALGPHLALALTKDPVLHARLLTLSPAEQFVELGAFKASVTAARTAAATPPKPVTSAPAPPAQTVGGASATPEVDTRKGVPFKDHNRIENEREAEARRQGRRY
jgi:hypothetical protein